MSQKNFTKKTAGAVAKSKDASSESKAGSPAKNSASVQQARKSSVPGKS